MMTVALVLLKLQYIYVIRLFGKNKKCDDELLLRITNSKVAFVLSITSSRRRLDRFPYLNQVSFK